MPATQRGHDVTALLHAWRAGDRRALEELIPPLKRELHRIAKHYMAAQPAGHTLQTTALVNEAYLHLIDARRASFSIARISSPPAPRSCGASSWTTPVPVTPPNADTDLVAVDEALEALEKFDPRKAKVVELRFFGGLSVEETAAILEISAESVMRDWRLARAWLARELSKEAPHGPGPMAED